MSGLKLDSLEGHPQFLTTSRELGNFDLGRGEKTAYDQYRFELWGRRQSLLGGVKWFEKSIDKKIMSPSRAYNNTPCS